jgi:MOSC domain-containing protein YiiM
MEGRVFQINIKPQTGNQRGLPKSPVDFAQIRETGLEGDYNMYRAEKLAGDANQAVLLFPLEMIRKLNDEGWLIQPGDIGENITSEGLDYDTFSPDSKYIIGNAVVELTKPCPPCRSLTILPYVGQEKLKEFMQTLLNRRGWFARVVKEGIVRTGDIIKRI